MHIITRRKLLVAAEKHGDLGEPLDVWYRVAKRAMWKNLMEVRQVYPSADTGGNSLFSTSTAMHIG